MLQGDEYVDGNKRVKVTLYVSLRIFGKGAGLGGTSCISAEEGAHITITLIATTLITTTRITTTLFFSANSQPTQGPPSKYPVGIGLS